MMAYLWLLNHEKKKKKKVVLTTFNVLFCTQSITTELHCVSESIYARSLPCFTCKIRYCYAITGFVLFCGPSTKKNWVCMHSINNPYCYFYSMNSMFYTQKTDFKRIIKWEILLFNFYRITKPLIKVACFLAPFLA